MLFFGNPYHPWQAPLGRCRCIRCIWGWVLRVYGVQIYSINTQLPIIFLRCIWGWLKYHVGLTINQLKIHMGVDWVVVSNIFSFGEDEPNLMSIFFKGVGSTTNQLTIKGTIPQEGFTPNHRFPYFFTGEPPSWRKLCSSLTPFFCDVCNLLSLAIRFGPLGVAPLVGWLVGWLDG